MKAERVEELSYREGEARPGQFAWVDREGEPAKPGEEARLVFCCPCGCGGYGSAPVRWQLQRTKRPEWHWNGDRDRPTLRPSVWFNKDRPGDWHGWLRNGEWQPAGQPTKRERTMGNRNSLAFRRNRDAILAGEVPEKYRRIVPHVTGRRVLEFGSAEGVLALLLAREGKAVTALEASADRHEDALQLKAEWEAREAFRPQPRFVLGKAADNLQLLRNKDTLVAVRTIYYFREALDDIFAQVAEHVRQVVLCGNAGRAKAWRAGQPHEPLGEFNRYAAHEGMRELLERHDYTVVTDLRDGDPILVGVSKRG